MNTAERQTRTRVSLDSEWKFCIDSRNSGKNRDLHSPSTIWPCDITETVSIPHIWQESEKYRSYTGTAWYRTTVEYDGRFEDEIRTAKKLGFNMLREHLKPAHPDFIEAADQAGILV